MHLQIFEETGKNSITTTWEGLLEVRGGKVHVWSETLRLDLPSLVLKIILFWKQKYSSYKRLRKKCMNSVISHDLTLFSNWESVDSDFVRHYFILIYSCHSMCTSSHVLIKNYYVKKWLGIKIQKKNDFISN